MNKKLNILIAAFLSLLVLQSVQIAFADFINQNHFNTTFAGDTQFLPKFQYGESSSSSDSGIFSYEDIGFTYMYGISEQTSVGTNLIWRKVKSDDDSVESMTDPEFFIYSKSSLNSDLHLFYGGQLSISPESSDYEKNHYEGGPSLGGYIGFQQFLKGAHSLVGNTSIQFFGERELSNDVKLTGIHIFQAHGGYEFSNSFATIGATIGVVKRLKGIVKFRNVENADVSEYDLLVGNIYSNFKLSENLNLIPSFKYFENLEGRDEEKARIYFVSTSLGFTY